VLRNNQAVTNLFTATKQIGADIFVTNTTVRIFTTDHITNVVVSLSTPTVTYRPIWMSCWWGPAVKRLC